MVSIIVPVYNAELYLKECVDSIRNQTHLDWELILVDDGSTDASGFLVDRYAESDRRIRALHFKNGGLSVARNRGIDAAYGEHIMFVDADDMLHPRTVETMMRHASRHPYHIISCDFIFGRVPAFSRVSATDGKLLDTDTAIARVLLQRKGTHNSAWAHLYPRGIFAKERFREGILYEDLDSFYRFLEASQGLCAVKAGLYFYRDTPGSLLNVWRRERAQVLDITERIERHMEQKSRRLVKAARSRRFSANFNMFILASEHGDKTLADRCWAHIKDRRAGVLFDPRTRMKNKAGALLSYLGRRAVLAVNRHR
ncbi:MAG: glycosyltransferase [Muribaculaceae bacterium]|nr:glycosyltransferase [Muribaculaceae bacterium]